MKVWVVQVIHFNTIEVLECYDDYKKAIDRYRSLFHKWYNEDGLYAYAVKHNLVLGDSINIRHPAIYNYLEDELSLDYDSNTLVSIEEVDIVRAT